MKLDKVLRFKWVKNEAKFIFKFKWVKNEAVRDFEVITTKVWSYK